MTDDREFAGEAFEELQRRGGGIIQPMHVEGARRSVAEAEAAAAGSLPVMTSTSAPAAYTDADIAMLPEEHWPTFSETEIQAVTDILRSGKVNQWTGHHVFDFQQQYDTYLGHGRRSIAMANGSVTLEVALRAFGIGAGDEVIVTPRTFAASAFCVMLVGATPVFADVDLDSGNITPETCAAVITERTKAIIPVHLAGWPVDMAGFMQLAEQHDLKIIEDAAQAHGAKIDGVPVGAIGHAASFSFCQDKIMSTGGEGGLVVFADEDRFDWAWRYKDHGKNPAKVFDPNKQPGFQWQLDSPGTNLRMLETSAAIGAHQLSELDATQAARAERAAIWFDALDGIDGLRTPRAPEHMTNAWYKIYAYVDRGAETEAIRDRILARMSERGLPAFSGSCSEIYLEEAFAHMEQPRLPNAKLLGEASLLFQVHPTLDLDRTRARAAVVADIVRDELG